MHLIALSGSGLILLYITLIFQKKNKKIKDYLLTLIFFVIGLELIFRFVKNEYEHIFYSWLIGLDLFYWVLFGPLMYLYVDFVIKDYRKFSSGDLMHFIPVIFIAVPYTNFLTSTLNNVHFFAYINNENLFYQIIVFIWDFITPVYFLFIVIKLIAHKRNAPNYFANLKSKDMGWLLFLSGGFLAYVIIAIALYYLHELFSREVPFISGDASIVPLIIYVFGLGIYGYRQEGIFSEEPVILKELGSSADKESSKLKYIRTGLSNEESSNIVSSLKDIMEDRKPFLDSELTINDLSKQVNTSIHKLSQVINESFQKNFYEFVNEYRIKEVEKLLNQPESTNLKIIALAYECGFNSKSAFYTAFKNYTGITPTEYRSKLQKKYSTSYQIN